MKPGEASSEADIIPTPRALTGRRGEAAVTRLVACPRCSRPRHLRPLEAGFQCADVICKFCGFLAQVKATMVSPDRRPSRLLGGSWARQHEQILADIFQALFIVTLAQNGKPIAIYYVPSHILRAHPAVYRPRNALAATARRPNFRGFMYDLTQLPEVGIQQVYPPDSE
ncbi:MAG: DpnI domain-containing protein [Fimbriimonadaceae bacterium]